MTKQFPELEDAVKAFGKEQSDENYTDVILAMFQAATNGKRISIFCDSFIPGAEPAPIYSVLRIGQKQYFEAIVDSVHPAQSKKTLQVRLDNILMQLLNSDTVDGIVLNPESFGRCPVEADDLRKLWGLVTMAQETEKA